MNLTEARQLLEKSGYSVQKLDEFWFKKEIPETFDDYKNAVIQVFKKNPFSDLIAIVKLVDFFNYIVKDSFNNKEPVAKCAKKINKRSAEINKAYQEVSKNFIQPGDVAAIKNTNFRPNT